MKTIRKLYIYLFTLIYIYICVHKKCVAVLFICILLYAQVNNVCKYNEYSLKFE